MGEIDHRRLLELLGVGAAGFRGVRLAGRGL
jgi:hypothetical protein